MKLFFLTDKMPILEEIQLGLPKPQLDEIDAISDTLDANIEKDIAIPKDVMDSFTIKDKLNPEIWNHFKLEPRVRFKLIKIAKNFLQDLELDKTIKIKDIYFTGSLSNFNWSKYSDIDLHIVLDFNQFGLDPKMVERFFYAQKSIWNQEHNITVFDYPVELYVQDKNHKLTATAIFSVLNNRWILKPKHNEFKIDKSAIKSKADKIIYTLKDIRQDYKDKAYQTVVDKVKKVKAKIKQMRMAGLERGGEFSLENLVFKVLRRTPFMDVLDSFKSKSYDSLMSVAETLNEQLLNKGGVLLIKGEKLPDGTSRLYITTIKNIIHLDRTKANDSMGQPANMVVISNDVYRITKENGMLKTHGVAWKSDASRLQRLGLTKNSLALNEDKTPLWRDTLKFNNTQQVINSIKSILSLPDVRWVD